MDSNTKILMDVYVKEIRYKMNYIIEEIDGDFEGWCELGTMLLFKVIESKFPDLSNEVAEGTFKGNGHFWNIIDGIVVDTTIDQFGRYKPGIINKRHFKNYSIKKKVEFNREDLNHMTQDIYPCLSMY